MVGVKGDKGGRSGQKRTEAENISEAGAIWLKYSPPGPVPSTAGPPERPDGL